MKPSTKRKSRRGGRGALIILALLLAGSGALRVGSGFGEAMARTSTADAGNASVNSLQCPKPPLAVAQALLIREEQLEAREAALADRLAALTIADRAIEERMVRLAAVEAEVSETLARADGAAEGDLARLTEMYQSMKPKDAATLFETMAPEFAAGFLGRMQPEAAGAILAGMTPESAYTVSVLLAGRNALVPKN